MARDRLRLKANFVSEFKLIGISSPGLILSVRPASTRGAYASSRNVGRDAMDVEVPLTSGAKADGQGVWS